MKILRTAIAIIILIVLMALAVINTKPGDRKPLSKEDCPGCVRDAVKVNK